MANPAILPEFLKLEATPIGVYNFGKTVYQVFRTTAPLPWTGAPVVALVLVGPRGAVYAMIDNGPKYYPAWRNFSMTTKSVWNKIVQATPFDRARVGREEFAAFLPVVAK